MAKKKKSKGKKSAPPPPAANEVKDGTKAQKNDLEEKATTESTVSNITTIEDSATIKLDTEVIASTTSTPPDIATEEKETTETPPSKKSEEDVKVKAMEEMVIHNEEDRETEKGTDTDTGTNISSITPEGEREVTETVTEASATTSKWGLLPDIDSSDDEEEEAEEEAGVTTQQKKEETEEEKSVQLEESILENSGNQESTLATPAGSEQAPVTPKWRVLSNEDSDDSDSDDDCICPYLVSTQAVAASKETISDVTVSDVSVETNETTIQKPDSGSVAEKQISSSEKLKRRTDFPAKIAIEEDGYNVCDRGISSGNMYLKNIQKDDPVVRKEPSLSIFNPKSSVSLRLNGVKTDLEVYLCSISPLYFSMSASLSVCLFDN
jgi:hypothetical protein